MEKLNSYPHSPHWYHYYKGIFHYLTVFSNLSTLPYFYSFHGFIDRIDTKKNSDGSLAYRVVDYKTSKAKIYEKSMPTAMQMFIYGYAVLNEFDVLPEEYLYRFILIDEYQSALTKG